MIKDLSLEANVISWKFLKKKKKIIISAIENTFHQKW